MVLRIPDGLVDRIGRRSPRLAAYLDWCDHGNMWGWGGPMNGQRGRCEIVRQLARQISFEAVVETGTYRGATTAFLADVTGAPTWTCELDARTHGYAIRRFRKRTDITVRRSDSRTFLQDLADQEDFPKADVLFYLDAHWNDDLPLSDELEIIARHWTRPAILIDDFVVPGDQGYGYDDYGPGRRLDATILPEGAMRGRTVLYPSMASQDESGARRGCALVVDESIAERLVQHLPVRPSK